MFSFVLYCLLVWGLLFYCYLFWVSACSSVFVLFNCCLYVCWFGFVGCYCIMIGELFVCFMFRVLLVVVGLLWWFNNVVCVVLVYVWFNCVFVFWFGFVVILFWLIVLCMSCWWCFLFFVVCVVVAIWLFGFECCVYFVLYMVTLVFEFWLHCLRLVGCWFVFVVVWFFCICCRQIFGVLIWWFMFNSVASCLIPVIVVCVLIYCVFVWMIYILMGLMVVAVYALFTLLLVFVGCRCLMFVWFSILVLCGYCLWLLFVFNVRLF